MALPLALHLLAAVVWVGGMFFAYMAMRPAVGEVLDPARRPALWAATLGRFFAWVWGAILVLLITGFGMIFGIYGGMAQVGGAVHAMLGLGIVMMLIFGHVYFAAFRRLKQAVASDDVQEGARRVGQIRKLVGLNLILGLLVVVIAAAGRYL
ncbi:hypothetical protein CEK62_06070 [Alcanivorax sp. N3-2A]|nr:hypothetical protein CEK62_06070 [Alcanivorax sp. N3-2A]